MYLSFLKLNEGTVSSYKPLLVSPILEVQKREEKRSIHLKLDELPSGNWQRRHTHIKDLETSLF